MFFDNIEQIPEIAARSNFTIFVVPNAKDFDFSAFPKSMKLVPDEKTGKINVDQVREFTALTNSKETREQFLLVCPAEAMNEAAENAFLKNLEEPKEHTHYVLVTSRPSLLLPTVLSRAVVYFFKQENPLGAPVVADEKVKALAKRLIVANESDLLGIATEITGKKDGAREMALNVVAVAVELTYKSYFATGNVKFLLKLPNLLKLYDNLTGNGHVKLHLVADML